jgi:hypothetical protein
VNATINLRFPCNARNVLISRDHVTSQKEHAPWSYLVTFGSSNEETIRVNKFV